MYSPRILETPFYQIMCGMVTTLFGPLQFVFANVISDTLFIALTLCSIHFLVSTQYASKPGYDWLMALLCSAAASLTRMLGILMPGVFLLARLACILGVGCNVLISSRATDVRAAQQLGSLIILPFGAVYFLTEFGFLDLNTDNLLYMAVAMLVIDAIIFYSIRVTFNRDEILTKWR